MSESTIGPRVAITGEAEFKKALANIDNEFKLLGSEMKLAVSQFEKNDKSTAALTAQNKVLGREIDSQKGRLSTLTTQYDKQNGTLATLKTKLDATKAAFSADSAEVAKAQREYDKQNNTVRGLQTELNKATTGLNKMDRELAANNKSIALQDSKWTKLGKSLDAIGTKMKTVGEGLINVGSKMSLSITAPIVAAGVAAAKLASDFNESLNKVDVAFGKNSGEVKSWSNTTLKSFGISKGSALEMASLFGDMGVAMGQTTPEAAKMSTGLVGLAGDLASFKNISIDQAQDALKGIFTGEGESLKSLGVIMQDSTLIAYAQATGQKKAYSEMTQAEKVALRYAFVMDATKNSQGDFARTSEGAANQTRTFGETMKELGTNMGLYILPVVTPIIAKLSEMAQSFGKLNEHTKKTILVIAGLVAAIGPALIAFGWLAFALSNIIKLNKTLALAKGAGSIGSVGSALVGLTGPVGVVLLLIAGLSAAWYIWGDDVKVVVDKINWQMSHLKIPGRTGGTNEGTMPIYVKPVYYGVSAGDEDQSTRWHASGGIFNRPSIIGVGEAGPEAVIPISKLKDILGGTMGGTMHHDGTIIVKGVNNEGQLVAVVEQQISKNILKSNRGLTNRPSLYGV